MALGYVGYISFVTVNSLGLKIFLKNSFLYFLLLRFIVSAAYNLSGLVTKSVVSEFGLIGSALK